MGVAVLKSIFDKAGDYARPIPRAITFSPGFAPATFNHATNPSIDPSITAWQQCLPPEKKLPADMQLLLKQCRALAPLEKLHAIHQFVLRAMTYQREDGPDPVKPFLTLAQQRHGDCDDYAYLEAALLKYAGFPGQDIAFFGGQITYSNPQMAPRTVDHAVTVVVCENFLYVMDMNLQTPALLQRDCTVRGECSHAQRPPGWSLTAKIEHPLLLVVMDEGADAWRYRRPGFGLPPQTPHTPMPRAA